MMMIVSKHTMKVLANFLSYFEAESFLICDTFGSITMKLSSYWLIKFLRIFSQVNQEDVSDGNEGNVRHQFQFVLNRYHGNSISVLFLLLGDKIKVKLE